MSISPARVKPEQNPPLCLNSFGQTTITRHNAEKKIPQKVFQTMSITCPRKHILVLINLRTPLNI